MVKRNLLEMDLNYGFLFLVKFVSLRVVVHEQLFEGIQSISE